MQTRYGCCLENEGFGAVPRFTNSPSDSLPLTRKENLGRNALGGGRKLEYRPAAIGRTAQDRRHGSVGARRAPTTNGSIV
jgi:hypothetical protein